MKEEIKLKYMIDFLENVYKDIKKQRRLEEELEKERKFINKIKGDSEDEVKELLEHIEILDNTDYILHSDKAKALLDYIENLQSQLKAKEETLKEARKLCKEEFMKNVMANLDSTLIFTYISNLEKENQELKDRINKAVEKLDETDYEYSSRTELFNIILNTTEILKEDNKEE